MLLHITKKCRMNCSHCAEDATPDGQYMSIETLYKSISFINKVQPYILLISGGEPTDHPEFLKFLDIILKKTNALKYILTSNGMFLENEKLKNELLKKDIIIQITNDQKYYPIKIEDPNLDKVEYYDELIHNGLTPFGRAKNLKNDEFSLNPRCFNPRSIFNNVAKECEVDILKTFVKKLETEYYRFCSFSITVEGEVNFSEWSQCKSIGNVNEPLCVLTQRGKDFKCNKCGLFNNMNIFEKLYLGED